MKFRKISRLKYMGKKGVSECLKTPSELLQKIWKNSWWFFILTYISMNFFQIFLSDRVLWRKSFLIVCFSPCYLNGKNEVLSASTSLSNWTLSPYGIFFIIFLETTSNGRTKKKLIWEIRNALLYTLHKGIIGFLHSPRTHLDTHLDNLISSKKFQPKKMF